MAITTFGRLLRTARFMTEPYITLYDMARKCGLSSARLSGIETGRNDPTREEIRTIAGCLMGMVQDTQATRRMIERDSLPPFPFGVVVPIGGEGNAQIRRRLPKDRPRPMGIPLQDDPGVPPCCHCRKLHEDIPDSRTECLAQNGGCEWWLYCPECDAETFSETFLEGVELL